MADCENGLPTTCNQGCKVNGSTRAAHVHAGCLEIVRWCILPRVFYGKVRSKQGSWPPKSWLTRNLHRSCKRNQPLTVSPTVTYAQVLEILSHVNKLIGIKDVFATGAGTGSAHAGTFSGRQKALGCERVVATEIKPN
eukprot:352206-Chlamydomonas_euryale.AAC.1